MAGVKGKSGRRPMVEEIKKHALLRTSYEITQAYLDTKGEPLKEKAHLAVGIVRTDMTKPMVVDQSQHTHITSVQVDNMQANDLVDLVMGRSSGRQDVKQSA